MTTPESFRIWVDADACPNAVKEIIFRAAERREIATTLVANQFIRVPKSKFIKSIQVPSGFDVADNTIVAEMQSGDLVITADIPLASEVIAAGGTALNPRGTFYDVENIARHLARRNRLEELRSTGMVTGGPPPLGKTDVQTFANQLDRFLTRLAQQT
jgi:uncharacterized protein YaiI (UPF0178 family)